jgi:formylglycine-generating enzyme required for sulfatase activity
MKKLFVVLFLFTAVFSFAQQNASAPQKFALVIGNGNYVNTTKLNNPVNDANDMAVALQGLGYTVDKLLNGTQDQMVNAVMQLKRRLSASKNSYGFLFYAGHGVQSGGENYLIPVDANIPSENFLRNRTVSVQEMLDELNDAGNEFNVVVLDACRDNPFSWKRSGSRGLSVVGQQPADSIIVYATAAGSTAADGGGRNGLFTSHLLNNLKTPGLEITEVFRRTGADVASASGNQQRPAVYSQFYGTAYLGSRPQTNTTAAIPPASASVVQPTPTPAPAVQTTPAPAVQTTPTPAPAVQVTHAPVVQSTSTTTPQPVPAMVRINGGTFMMGSPANEQNRDRGEERRQVTVSGCYMGRYEVTQKEYQEVIGTNPSNFKGDNLPVEQVSWYDAVEYCNERSQREGLTAVYTINKNQSDPNNTNNNDTVKWTVTWNKNANGYRLPTEAEWEYACRAGTTTAYNTGAVINSNTGWYSNNSGSKTHPVGQKKPNAWGLYDMHGNVSEWCWDWYGGYSIGSQTDPVGAVTGSYRVGRGGNWDSYGRDLRSALRYSDFPSFRFYRVGFRVVRN